MEGGGGGIVPSPPLPHGTRPHFRKSLVRDSSHMGEKKEAGGGWGVWARVLTSVDDRPTDEGGGGKRRAPRF